MKIVRRANVALTSWVNGGGVTRELLVDRLPNGTRIRVSMAEIASDGPFSALPGVARSLILVNGGPVDLTIDGHEVSLGTEQAVYFRGEATTSSTLRGDAAEDLGVMVWGAEPALLRVIDSTCILSCFAVVCVRGTVQVDNETLGYGDLVCLDGLAKITPAADSRAIMIAANTMQNQF